MTRAARALALSLVAACAPAPGERGDVCADVGAVRACWSGVEPPRVSPRALPSGPGPEAGYRCTGGGEARVCVDRALGGGPFACDGDRCVQLRPRLPDDGEWECADLEGVVVCRGGARAAGVIEGAPDPGWMCGTRLGARDRICVDMAPDMPRGATRGYACSSLRDRGGARSCKAEEAAPKIGGPCGACPRGAVCAAGICLPRAPKPDCWVDPDCGAGRVCAFGTCGAIDG